MMVIAPTARSPPYLERLEVKLMERILSVESMTKVEIPSARQGRIMSLRKMENGFLSGQETEDPYSSDSLT